MIDEVFISDLHLNPSEPDISARFKAFVQWASTHTRVVYILGDFFHAWAGDDTLDTWSISIADELVFLASQGVQVYFMPGNRDFLVGQTFAYRAKMQYLREPFVITLGSERILLVHGDRYCTKDKAHQWFRRLTRNRLFNGLFLCLNKSWRLNIVARVRAHSQNKPYTIALNMQTVPSVLVRHMKQWGVCTVVHGHTHQPGLITHQERDGLYQQYILSDWDAPPQVLCYNKTKGFYYIHFSEEAEK